jgi:hypothetical protein
MVARAVHFFAFARGDRSSELLFQKALLWCIFRSRIDISLFLLANRHPTTANKGTFPKDVDGHSRDVIRITFFLRVAWSERIVAGS